MGFSLFFLFETIDAYRYAITNLCPMTYIYQPALWVRDDFARQVGMDFNTNILVDLEVRFIHKIVAQKFRAWVRMGDSETPTLSASIALSLTEQCSQSLSILSRHERSHGCRFPPISHLSMILTAATG